MPTLHQNAFFGAQLTYNSASGTGSYIAMSGSLAENPAIIIFDNQSNVAVTLSQNGSTAAKTFAANQSMIIDLRTNASPVSGELTFRDGTLFYASSSAGTGNFYISYIYAG